LKSKPTSSSPQPPATPSRTASLASVESESTITSGPDNQPSTATLPPHLDDPAFDVAAYVRTLLQTESLQGILKIESSLVSEIKQLDGERKALVYDNYSKLIVATQTIGRMQKSLNESDEGGAGGLRNMEKLRPAVEGIEKLASELGAAEERKVDGAPKHAERRREKEKRELVRWVVEAPVRFEKLIQEGRGKDIRAEWEVVNGLLEKWKGVGGVDGVRKACEKIIDGLEKRVDHEE
jgi:vacuolar protein sorting-associated protein 51